MTRLLPAEILKLRTTRTFWVISLGALFVVAGTIVPTAAGTTFGPSDRPAQEVLAIAGMAQTLTLLLGVLAVTGEYRHGTITPALLVTPRRTPVLLAKLVVLGAVGIVIGLLAFGEAAAIALPVLASRHIAAHLSTAGLVEMVAGGALATALFAGVGVGLGAIVRNQVGAVVTALGLLYVAGPLLGLVPVIGTAVQRFGFAGVSSGASDTASYPYSTHLLGQPAAIAVLAGYTVVVVLAGALLLRNRDLPA